MVERTVALFENQQIGIETIYTVIDGLQINIPEKLEDLRRKSNDKKLFCPCGCGSNLTLVAGNIRAQHFRLKASNENSKCDYKNESKESVYAKIVLKCWLDDKINDQNLKSRVALSQLYSTDSKYEISFLSEYKKLGVVYWNKKENIEDDKIKKLKNECKDCTFIFVVGNGENDNDNVVNNNSFQYPENLAKIERVQGYSLILEQVECDYYQSNLYVIFHEKNKKGYWNKYLVKGDKISNFSLDDNNKICYKGKTLDTLVSETKKDIATKIKQAEETEKRKIEEARKREEEYRKKEAEERQLARIKQTLDRLAYEHKLEKETKEFANKQQSEPALDPIIEEIKRISQGGKTYKCLICGQMFPENELAVRGGSECESHSGKCRSCLHKEYYGDSKN